MADVRVYASGGTIIWPEDVLAAARNVGDAFVSLPPNVRELVFIGEPVPAWPPLHYHARRWRRRAYARNSDAMRLDASRAEADAELAEWRALLDAAKGRRRG